MGARKKSKIITLDFRTADCSLFRDLLERIPGKKRGPGQQMDFQVPPPGCSRTFPKEQKIKQRCQEISNLMPTKFKHKKEVHKRWEQGQVAWEE